MSNIPTKTKGMIAGLLLAVPNVIGLISHLNTLFILLSYSKDLLSNISLLFSVTLDLGLLALGVALILDKIELASRAAMGAMILVAGSVLMTIGQRFMGGPLVIIISLLSVAQYVLLFLALSKHGEQGPLSCLVALGISVFSFVINMSSMHIQANEIDPEYPNLVNSFSLIFSLLTWAAYVFLAFYVADKEPKDKPVVAPTANVNRGSANSNMSDIEKLTRLKSLLDSGAISQEEFEAKKRQILGR